MYVTFHCIFVDIQPTVFYDNKIQYTIQYTVYCICNHFHGKNGQLVVSAKVYAKDKGFGVCQ